MGALCWRATSTGRSSGSRVSWTASPRHGRGTGVLKFGPWSKVTRRDAAGFMLSRLGDDSDVRQAPMVCS